MFFVLMMVFTFVKAQEKETIAESWKKLEEKYSGYYISTDPNKEIALDTLVIFPKPKFKTNYDKRYYYWFRKKTFKAYPYAVLFKNNMDKINDSLVDISSKRKRKKFIKKKQRYFEEAFTTDVKKLTRTEGRVLVKLIHRLTGLTVNGHLQDKRGKFKAFLYRSSARVFKIKLDLEYHPDVVMEDYMIESILQEAFVHDKLEEYPSVLESGGVIFPSRVIEIKKNK